MCFHHGAPILCWSSAAALGRGLRGLGSPQARWRAAPLPPEAGWGTGWMEAICSSLHRLLLTQQIQNELFLHNSMGGNKEIPIKCTADELELVWAKELSPMHTARSPCP